MKKVKSKTKRVAFVFNTKKGNEIFNIGEKTYIIMKRPDEEIGSQGNYATKILIEISNS